MTFKTVKTETEHWEGSRDVKYGWRGGAFPKETPQR